MSWNDLFNVIDRVRRPEAGHRWSSTARHLAILLADHVNRKKGDPRYGTAFPSQKTLGLETGHDRKTVRAALLEVVFDERQDPKERSLFPLFLRGRRSGRIGVRPYIPLENPERVWNELCGARILSALALASTYGINLVDGTIHPTEVSGARDPIERRVDGTRIGSRGGRKPHVDGAIRPTIPSGNLQKEPGRSTAASQVISNTDPDTVRQEIRGDPESIRSATLKAAALRDGLRKVAGQERANRLHILGRLPCGKHVIEVPADLVDSAIGLEIPDLRVLSEAPRGKDDDTDSRQ